MEEGRERPARASRVPSGDQAIASNQHPGSWCVHVFCELLTSTTITPIDAGLPSIALQAIWLPSDDQAREGEPSDSPTADNVDPESRSISNTGCPGCGRDRLEYKDEASRNPPVPSSAAPVTSPPTSIVRRVVCSRSRTAGAGEQQTPHRW